MIKKPTQVRFFVPTTLETFDATVEPTLEGIAGKDYLGNTVASGGQVINAMDGHPNRTFQANTDGSIATWRIDVDMGQNVTVSFLIVNIHNLEEAYSAQVEDLVNIYHNTVDAFGTSTLASLVKEVGSSDIYVQEFGPHTKRYWFIEINPNSLQGVAGKNAQIGQMILGTVYTFQGLKTEGGYGGEYGYPGISKDETDAGIVQAERRYGVRPTWDIIFQLSTDAQFTDLQEMIDAMQNGLYPLWVSFDYDQSPPTFWRARLDGGLTWAYRHALSQPWAPGITLIGDV